MSNQPVILLTFANDEDAHLDMLKLESHAVYDALEDVHNEDIIEVKREESASIEIIADRLNKYQEDIFVYHYSGHASGQHLGLEGGSANSGGIAKLLAGATNMQLVVLNGCASFGQVEELLNLGIKAVIATTTAIGDTKAKEFSEQFYLGLGEYKNIQQSFKQAMAFLEAKYSDIDKEASKPKKGLRLKRKTASQSQSDISWGLYYDDDKVLDWKLNQNLKFKTLLREGSKVFQEKLWTSRYEYLEISDAIIPNVKSELECPEESEKTNLTPLEYCLKAAIEKENHNLFVTGDVGRGKTTSLLQIWRKRLKTTDWNEPIPIFIALTDYNISENINDFIVQYIAINYLGHKRPTNQAINEIWEILKTPIDNNPFKPSIVLLLDGLDEITKNTMGLINEIKNIAQEGKGCQIVLTSRIEYVFRWIKAFNKVEVKRLTHDQVVKFLETSKLEIPTNKDLVHFIKIPMILTLYTTSSSLTERYKNDKRLDFKDHISTYSELVWNFTEAMIAESAQKLEDKQFYYIKFMLRHFMPYLAYKMVKEDTYTFCKDDLDLTIKEASEYLYKKHFLEAFPLFIPWFRNFKLEANNWLEELERSNHKINVLVNQLHMMGREDNNGEGLYYFTQRHYRDFFGAIHVLNDINISSITQILPASLGSRRISNYNKVGLYIGELCEEHHNTSEILQRRRTWKRVEETVLTETLDLCRNKFEDVAATNITWNILTIWKQFRKHYASADLTNLNLTDFLFDELPLRHFRKHPVHPANLQGSILNGKNFISQGHTKGVNAVAYSPDGTKILSASQDKTIKEWSVSTGKCLQTFEGHKDVVKCIAYHNEGAKILSGSNDGTIKEWEVETGKCTATFEEHEEGVTSIKYLPDNEYFLSGSTDKTVRLWNIKSQKVERTFDKFEFGVVNISVHPDGLRFIALTREKSFLEWEIKTGQLTHTFVGHEMPVESAIYTRDGLRVISCSYDATVKLWTLDNETCVQTFQGHNGPVIGLDYHPFSDIIISFGRDDTIREWDLGACECLRTLEMNGISSLTYHSGGRRFIAGSWNNMIIEWDAIVGKTLQTFEGYSNQVKALACSPDGSFLISGASDNTIRKWDIATSICVMTFNGHDEDVESLAFSSDGRYILSGSDDHTIKLWQSNTGECLKTYKGHTNIVKGISFHQNGRKFVSGSYDKTIKEWDVHSGECLHTLEMEENSDAVNCVAYSPDGKLVAGGYNNSLLKVWNIEEENCINVLSDEASGHDLMVYSVAFHPSGKYVITGSEDKTIKEWDIEKDICIRTFEGHTKPVESIAYNPDGDRIISASRDHNLIEWNVKTGAILNTLEGHREIVSSAIYSPDGKSIFSGSMDNTIKKWEALSNDKKINPKKDIDKKVATSEDKKKKLEDKKELIKKDIKESKEENKSFFQTISKITERLTDTVKNVVIDHKDTSIDTYTSASGLYLQGADFRNLHDESKFLNKAKELMRQYGAIFDDNDAQIWKELKDRLRRS